MPGTFILPDTRIITLPNIVEDVTAPRFPADGGRVYYVGERASILFFCLPVAGGECVHTLTVDLPRMAFDKSLIGVVNEWRPLGGLAAYLPMN